MCLNGFLLMLYIGSGGFYLKVNIMRILVTDDHAMVRSGLCLQLRQDFPGVVIQECSNGEETLAQLRENRYDIVILDVSMPGQRNGTAILKEIVESWPRQKVLMLSGMCEKMYAKRLIDMGAAGYLNKSKALSELVNAIRTILNGEKYFSESVADQILKQTGQPTRPVPDY